MEQYKKLGEWYKRHIASKNKRKPEISDEQLVLDTLLAILIIIAIASLLSKILGTYEGTVELIETFWTRSYEPK